MQANYIFKELTTIPEMIKYFPIIRQLQTHLTLAEYNAFLPDMIAHGYAQVGVFHQDECIGISGYWISTKLYSGKYLEMDNVIIDEKYRSKGIGKLLCDWCINKAKANKCQTVMLDAYVENEKAHRFYEREGFIKRGYHFLKRL